jgi:hypothetical protein
MILQVHREGNVEDERIYDNGNIGNTQSALYDHQMRSSSLAGLHIGKQ